MMRLALLTVTLGLAAGCAAAAKPQTAARSDPDRGFATCAIAEERTGGFAQLTAIARATRAVTGTYEFRIKQRDRDGAADIVQGGPFQARAGEALELGTVGIDPDKWRATLTLTAPGQPPVRCTAKA